MPACRANPDQSNLKGYPVGIEHCRKPARRSPSYAEVTVMTPGEPLEETKDAESDSLDAVAPDPAPDGPANREAVLIETARLLSQTVGVDESEAETDRASLDAEVENLLSAIAEDESERDEAWVMALQHHDGAQAGEDDPDPPRIEAAPVTQDDATQPDAAEDGDGTPALRKDDGDGDGNTARPDGDPAPEALAALRAIDALGERFEAAEARNDEALGRIGHALGMIAQRIDGLEARATDRTIADVAFVAAPPEDDDEEDGSVAPYIARAEKELKAKKESGSMDIFDRIARAAETEFDDQAGTAPSRVVANASDGRRVGTKRWQPSRAVKKRMEKLEKIRAESALEGRESPERRPPAMQGEPEEAAAAAPVARPDAPVAPAVDLDLSSEPTFDPAGDDAGLSVVPGARGRRRNRARKSSLDTDFENVFAEEGDKPSIQSLRRKMRELPVEAPDEDEKSKGGMLGTLLGRKPAKKAGPAAPSETPPEEGEDDDDLLAAFDSPDAPALPRKPGKGAKAPARAAMDEDDDLDDDLDDYFDDGDDASRSGTRRKPLVYALIAAAAAAGLAVWKMFLA